MATILIDAKGLIEGRRLRKLSTKARYLYPIFLGLSNFYARLELDYELLVGRLVTFHDPDVTLENIEAWFNKYKQAYLCFIYQNGEWAQFDTPVEMRRDYPSKEDNKSPAPPDTEYTNWLKGLHGDNWEDYHMTKYRDHIS
ncbi:MAG: hypothetical protein ABSC48_02905 [Terracidiphilus sp.]|jgi:hypothetical protein